MGNVRAVDVGRSLRLVPYWQQRAATGERKEIVIDPGPSFGAGDHPTTVMALELLEKAMDGFLQGTVPSLLDVGTGTGVLAIAGKALGAGLTVAFDPDPAAVFTARRNFGLNGLWEPDAAEPDRPLVFVGGVEAVSGSFDIVAVNLVAPLLLRLLDAITPRVGHWLILSGIADPMAEQTLNAYGNTGLGLVTSLSRGGWNAALFVTGIE
jgi:ribosomal protein L11 methyltransferase